MIKNLSPQEKEVLARILMPYIVRFLDNADFGMRTNDDPRLNYVRPHLSLSSLDMLDKYLAKLSPTRRKWLDDNCEAVILANSIDIRPSELGYYLNLAKQIRLENGGVLINDGKRRKPKPNNIRRSEDNPTPKSDGKNPNPKPKK